MTPLLFDTDVLIDYLRGHPAAISYLETLQAPVFTSAITVAELYAGVREGQERARPESFLSCFHIIELDQESAVRADRFA